MSIILFILILGVLVLVHEWGHFIAAKKSGIRVDEFAIGFPPRLFSWRRGETLFSLNLLPIGGYVKIFGENPDDESISGPDKSRSFVHKSKLTQIGVLGAGVFMNVLFCWLLFIIAINIGLPVPEGYAGDKALISGKVLVSDILQGSPAEKAGLHTGDRIVSIKKGEETFSRNEVDSVRDFIAKSGGSNLTFVLEDAAGHAREVSVIPQSGVVEGRPAIGVSLGQLNILKLPFFQSIWEAGKITIYLLGAIALGLFDLLKNAVVGQADLAGVTGPVGIVTLVGDATAISFTYLLSFIAMISANLAIINILPLPALDGGRILFVIIESIIRRPIKPIIANSLNIAGFALLMLLMVVITWKDIANLF